MTSKVNTNKKKKLTVALTIIAVLLATLIIALCVLYIPRSVKKLMPNEKIVSIVMYEDYNPEERIKLSEDKIELFNEKLGKLKYVKHYNYFCNCIPHDYLTFLITYETHELYITRASIILLHNGEYVNGAYTEQGMKPEDVFDELITLFKT